MKKSNFTEGAILSPLLRFMLPVLLAIVNNISLAASAGVGVAEKVCAFIMLVPSAFMQSMSSFVAQNIGAGKQDRAKKYCFTAFRYHLYSESRCSY